MPITRVAQAPQFDLDGFHFLGYTSPSLGARELCTWQLSIDPGAISDAHKLNHEEVFIVLQGNFSILLEGEETELTTGDACTVPANCLLQVTNRSNQVARALVSITAGFRATLADGSEIGTPPWAQ